MSSIAQESIQTQEKSLEERKVETNQFYEKPANSDIPPLVEPLESASVPIEQLGPESESNFSQTDEATILVDSSDRGF